LLVGEMNPLKSALLFTFSSRLPLCVMLPLVPVMVRMESPLEAVVGGVTERIDVPEPPEMTAGLKLRMVPAGAPLALSVTSPVNPLIGDTDTM